MGEERANNDNQKMRVIETLNKGNKGLRYVVPLFLLSSLDLRPFAGFCKAEHRYKIPFSADASNLVICWRTTIWNVRLCYYMLVLKRWRDSTDFICFFQLFQFHSDGRHVSRIHIRFILNPII